MRQLRRTNEVSIEFNHVYRGLTSDAKLGDSWLDILLTRSIRVRLFISLFIQLSQELVGIQIITVYGFVLLQKIGIHSILGGITLATICAGIGILVFLNYVDVVGRKVLLIIGFVLMFVSWLGAAGCVYYGKLQSTVYLSSFTLRVIFCSFLCIISFSYSMSLGPISWVLPAEIFPFRARAKAVSLSSASHFASALLGCYTLLEWQTTGYDTVGYMINFSLICLLLTVLVYLIIPETKGN